MTAKFSLREFGKHLRTIMACPTCGKSRMVHATAWKGRGTGQRGEAAYDATAFEGVTAETHCTG